MRTDFPWDRTHDGELRSIYALSVRREKTAAINELCARLRIPRRIIYAQADRLGITNKDVRKEWTQEEHEALVQMAGLVPVGIIARRLKRNKRSVALKLWAERISWRAKTKGYSRGEISRLMGVGEKTVRAWIDSGRLAVNVWNNVNESALLDFLAANVERIELRTIDQQWLKQMLRKIIGHFSHSLEMVK